MKPFTYGKRESDIIKGIAIILMFVHHLFGFPMWIDTANLYKGIEIHGYVIEEVIAVFCKVCVGLFAFTSGYAMFVHSERYKKIKNCLARALQFLVQYWVVFLFFLVVGVIVKEPLPTIETFLLQCFGIHTATGFSWSYNTGIHPKFAWYVSFYLIFLMLHPLLSKLSKFNFWIDNIIYLITFYGGYFIITGLLPINSPGTVADIYSILSRFATWGHIGMEGYLFAKYDMFEKIDNVIRKHLNCFFMAFFSVLTIICIMYVRLLSGIYVIKEPMSFDVLYTIFLIYSFLNIINIIKDFGISEKWLLVLGKYSMTMWFLHSIFFTPKNTLQGLAYWPKYPIFILIWTLIIMLLCSIPINKLQKKCVTFLVRKK